MAEEKKYVIQFDRESCIGAAACTVASVQWIIVSDGKADLNDMIKNESTNYFEREIPENELKEHTEAAQSCPVNVIHIIDKDSGKKLI